MTTYQIIQMVISLLGIPSLFTLVGRLYARLKVNEKKNKKEYDSIKLGVQAMLRSQMINDYTTWAAKGYAPIYAREAFENNFKQYENLGINGVMQDIYRKFFELPISLEEKDG